jgi:hypothetical protein
MCIFFQMGLDQSQAWLLVFIHNQFSSLASFGLEICETLTKSTLSLLLMMHQT